MAFESLLAFFKSSQFNTKMNGASLEGFWKVHPKIVLFIIHLSHKFQQNEKNPNTAAANADLYVNTWSEVRYEPLDA